MIIYNKKFNLLFIEMAISNVEIYNISYLNKQQ